MTKLPGKFTRSLRPVPGERVGKRMNTWQSVRAEVLERIRSREWPPGELIPTEQELAVQLGCARATVNRALRELADSGIIERRRKVGTRVTSTQSRRTRLEIPAMRQEIEGLGASYNYELTHFEVRPANDQAKKALQLDPGQSLTLVKGQYLANGVPHCCEVIWLNQAVLPPFQRADFEETPALEWLARNVALTTGRFSILAESAVGDCARLLNIADGTPGPTIERASWSDAAPVSFLRRIHPPEHRLISED